MENGVRFAARTRRPGAVLAAVTVLSLTATLSGADTTDAEAIRAETGVVGGVIVHLGCGDGALTAALRASDSTVVHGLDRNAANVAAARRTIRQLGVYGPVSVEHWRSPQLPYAENLVNLVVADGLERVPMAEVMRVLAPNGVALVRREGRWEKTVKPWPDDIDEWTHFLHGADNNAVARDTAIGPPSRVQWAAGPRWARDHDVTSSVFALVSAGGRLFYVIEDGPVCVVDARVPDRYAVIARDAFNGVVLWKRPMSTWVSSRVIWGHVPVHSQRRLVAIGARVYVTPGLQAPVIALDAATGETVLEYPGTEFTSEIVCDHGVLALGIRKEEPTGGLLAGRDGTRFRRGYTGPDKGGEAVLAVDAASGACLWRQQRAYVPLTLALSAGRVLFVEEDHVICLDARSGKQLWRTACPARTLVVSGGMVLAATDRNTAKYSSAPKTVQITAFSLADGKRVWTASGDCLPNFNFFYLPVDVFVARGQVWGLAEGLEWNKEPGTGHLLGLDVATGAVTTRISLSGAFTPGHHVRCYKGKATDRFLLFNKRGIEFVNIESGGKPIQHQWIRGACRYGILPCNGLLYAPSHACACYPGAKLDGFHALSSAAAHTAGERLEPAPLEKGPAYGLGDTLVRQVAEVDGNAWPTYRHDMARSGSTSTVVPSDVGTVWRVDLGGKLTAPIAVGGCVYVAAVDEHTLHCLAAADGRALWSFTAGGRVDSPPTVHGGLVLFGSHDGWCYCLNAADGSLVWRFRAAPAERRIGAFGQLESAWPLFGSVLVQGDTAYVVAGRSSFVDGGMAVYGLDIGSGSVRHRATLVGPDPGEPTATTTAGRMPGSVPDILSYDGDSLYLRHVRLRRDLSGDFDAAALSWGVKSDSHLLAGSGFLDDTLFNRSVWTYGRRIGRSQMLVLDGADVYGLRVYSGISWNCSVHNVGDGYLLFRQDVSKPVPQPPPEKRKLLNRIPYERYRWHTRVPARVGAMVLTGTARQANASPADKARAQSKRLFVAGQPDEIDPDDPHSTFEGRRGARLLALSGESGEVVAEHKLDAVPVWDGMIAYRGRLYLTLRHGGVLCLGARDG